MSRKSLIPSVIIGFILVAHVGGTAPATSPISVRLSRESFNPSLGETIGIDVVLKARGTLNVLVLDRDAYPVRWLVEKKPLEAGSIKLHWDAKNDSGQLVADEAYSLKIDFTSNGKTETYFPAQATPERFSVTDVSYDRENAVLRYRLPRPCRVHVQAGMAEGSPTPEGPVLRTIANAVPRGSGMILETWRGMDESGSIYIPDLPHFVVSVAAWSLPENAIIVLGNREGSFLEAAQQRSGSFLLGISPSHHHQGLNALQDVSPPLEIKLLNAEWDATRRAWKTQDAKLRMQAHLTGPAASAFLAQPTRLLVYRDMDLLEQKAPRTSTFTVDLPVSTLKAGEHIIALNVASDYGPAAVQSFRLIVEHQEGQKMEGRNAKH